MRPRPSRWRSFASTSTRASRWWAFARPATPSIRAARPPRGTRNGSRSIPTCWGAITPGIMPTMFIPDHTAPERQDSPDLDGIETPFVSHGSLYKVSPLAGSARSSLDGDDPRPAARAGRVDQHARAVRVSSTRRWGTRLISRSPRSASCSRTRSSGHSTGRRVDD